VDKLKLLIDSCLVVFIFLYSLVVKFDSMCLYMEYNELD